MRPWERIRDLTSKLGGELVLVSHDRLCRRGVSYSPSDDRLACHYSKRKVYVANDALMDANVIGCLVHELGHVFAHRQVPHSVDDEGDFLGWEHLVSIELGIRKQWLASMKTYQVLTPGKGYHQHQYSEFGQLSPGDKRLVIAKAIEDGIKYGNIRDGKPVAIR